MTQTLYLKTHNKTGLKYLGQTTKDPFKYLGSGKYWKSHIIKHGNDIHTKILFESTDLEKFKEACRAFSIELNVVEDDNYANLVEEVGGVSHGPAGPNYRYGIYCDPGNRKELNKIKRLKKLIKKLFCIKQDLTEVKLELSKRIRKKSYISHIIWINDLSKEELKEKRNIVIGKIDTANRDRLLASYELFYTQNPEQGS